MKPISVMVVWGMPTLPVRPSTEADAGGLMVLAGIEGDGDAVEAETRFIGDAGGEDVTYCSVPIWRCAARWSPQPGNVSPWSAGSVRTSFWNA